MYHRYHHYIHINVIIGFCPFFLGRNLQASSSATWTLAFAVGDVDSKASPSCLRELHEQSHWDISHVNPWGTRPGKLG